MINTTNILVITVILMLLFNDDACAAEPNERYSITLNGLSYHTTRRPDQNELNLGLGFSRKKDVIFYGYDLTEVTTIGFFTDTNSDIEPYVGYGGQRVLYSLGDVDLGLGALAGVSYRTDTGVFPYVLPFAFLEVDKVSFNGFFVPPYKERSGVFFINLELEF